ncbi:unnamed protein product, partial [Iphiclides podalirius]
MSPLRRSDCRTKGDPPLMRSLANPGYSETSFEAMFAPGGLWWAATPHSRGYDFTFKITRRATCGMQMCELRRKRLAKADKAGPCVSGRQGAPTAQPHPNERPIAARFLRM